MSIKKVELLYCSFCGKDHREVRKLISGPTAYICNECVDVCVEVCQDSDAEVRIRDRMRERGEVIVSSADADRLRWMRTWVTSPPAPSQEPSHIVVG